MNEDYKAVKTNRPEQIAQPVKHKKGREKLYKAVRGIAEEGQTNHESNDRHVPSGASKTPKGTSSTSNNN